MGRLEEHVMQIREQNEISDFEIHFITEKDVPFIFGTRDNKFMILE